MNDYGREDTAVASERVPQIKIEIEALDNNVAELNAIFSKLIERLHPVSSMGGIPPTMRPEEKATVAKVGLATALSAQNDKLSQLRKNIGALINSIEI